MTDSSFGQWILVLSLTALLLSLAVLVQIATRYAAAYLDAPAEVCAFLEAVDSSIAENESYDRDIAKVRRLEDKLRLGRLLRDIQKGGDALREDLSSLVAGQDDPRLRNASRVLWAVHRLRLEEKVRRLDLLRMRFLVVHMGIIAGVATEAAAATAAAAAAAKKDMGPRDMEKSPGLSRTSQPTGLPNALLDGIKSKPPLRRQTVHTVIHQENVEGNHRRGWAGVVMELQKSPLLHKRHASIEMATRSP
ncbi:hypothetical protein N658DRAFT_420370 [Parathielavia hyrcaniae]|uniref:Uncharacterized protein n=1 Tax=Parathielavia hyrcaniae TaxID=113614 RepID=A0AAN6Q6C8_9PEZI|nr:hypothetical protein N658DRAFT_420370 [Parathielavia hyrcaniae]